MKTRILLSIFIATTLAMYSCRKKGCTMPNYENYDPDAEKDDGSCTCERYFINPIEVNHFPHTYKDTSAAWDTTLYHRLIVVIKDESDYYSYNYTNTDSLRTAFSINLTSPYQDHILLYKRNTYYLELIDQSAPFNNSHIYGPPDPFSLYPTPVFDGGVIASALFNPLEQGTNGNILLNGSDGTEITLHYSN